MQIVCVIPARLDSSRLAHKPLQTIAGQPLIRLVAQRARDLGCFDHIVVATDALQVVEAVGGLGVEAVLTSPSHRNGTERVAEVMGFARFRKADVFVNLQGDHPFVAESAIRGVIELVEQGANIATVAAPLRQADREDPHTVKVFVDDHSHAVDFTRAAQPPAGVPGPALHHVGVYAYHPEALARWATAPQVDRELAEGLEQLRPMAYGATIAVCQVKDHAAPGIDTIDDLRRAEEFLTVFR